MKIYFKIFLSITIFLIFLLNSCIKEEFRASIFGSIIDNVTGEGVPNSTVFLNGKNMGEAEESKFYFDNLKPDDYFIYVIKDDLVFSDCQQLHRGDSEWIICYMDKINFITFPNENHYGNDYDYFYISNSPSEISFSTQYVGYVNVYLSKDGLQTKIEDNVYTNAVKYIEGSSVLHKVFTVNVNFLENYSDTSVYKFIFELSDNSGYQFETTEFKIKRVP